MSPYRAPTRVHAAGTPRDRWVASILPAALGARSGVTIVPAGTLFQASLRRANHQSAAIRPDSQLHLDADEIIAVAQLHQGTEQMLERDSRRTPGEEPFGPTMEASLRKIAFERRHRQLCRRPAGGADHSDRPHVSQIEIQQRFAHSAPYCMMPARGPGQIR
ncbi:hypothetical protein NITMOv2_2248 [Nitrospira moscoviensis]|uniref:Uncharacterized protein n=1 Tax=Nitrospira moscoviensis TaxID=42253 RepID=A0A0K2GCS4_NITMO|nr:hypothetical protein NITMOv2_2248 [Nitrospira moscoviensis]